MEKLKYILRGFIVTLLMVSCGDSFFEQYPSNSITEGNHYKTDDDFNQGVRSCYAALKSMLSFHQSELAYRGDECILESMAVSTQDRYNIDHFVDLPGNTILVNIWNSWYNGIYRCNDVLDHMEGKEIANYSRYRGELLFLRSWWYFNLYRTFGVVPITQTVVTPEQSKRIPRCTEEEMYNLLFSDLSESAKFLPERRDAEVARVSKTAAYALLAKVCLTFQKHTEAKEVMEEIFKDQNYGLMGTTAEAFDIGNKMNKEIIFATYYNKSTDNGHGVWYSVPSTVESDIRNPTPEFKAIYTPDDNRYPLISTYTEIGPNVYVMNKWYDTYDATYSTLVGNDFPHLRYTDVVLMYAEAMNELDDLDTALEYLNKTRTRAGLVEITKTEVSGKNEFREVLAEERAKELALEGHRWFDLVRLGLAVDFFRGMGYTLDAHNLIFPIPQSQIEIVNDKSILWQNPGY